MEARIGDHVVLEGARVGHGRRRGEVLEVLRGTTGDRYRVRWEQDDHETVLAPGPDLRVEATGEPKPERLSMRIDLSVTEDADHTEALARVHMCGREFRRGGGPAGTRTIPPRPPSARSSPSPGHCPKCPISSSWPRPTPSSRRSAARWRSTCSHRQPITVARPRTKA